MVKKIPKKNNQKKITKAKSVVKKISTKKGKNASKIKIKNKAIKSLKPKTNTPKTKIAKLKSKSVKKAPQKNNNKNSLAKSAIKNTKSKTTKILKEISFKDKLSFKKSPHKTKEISKKNNSNSLEKNSKKNINKIEKPSKKKIENPINQPRQPFKAGDYAVYPSHGVGKIIEIENTTIMGQNYSCYLMYFEKEKLSIKIPVLSAEKNNLRRIASKPQMEEVLNILRSGIKKLKGMWSRRAQEYETKINSGDIILLAEVLRDLTRDIEDSDRSYSERIIYETAIFRLASEYAIIYNVDIEVAKEKIINIAKDKINSEVKSNSKDDFDDFDIEDRKSKKDIDDDGDEEDEDEEEEEDEDDDFNYNFDEIDEDDDEDDDDKPKKKRK